MKISELIKCLEEILQRHGDVQAIITFEGQIREIKKESISVVDWSETGWPDKILLIDVEY